jgi:hypothetical protein
MMKGLKVIEVASKEVGTVESPANSNKTKYGKWFGLDGVAWCAIFVSWCYDKAGLNLGPIGFKKGYAGCMTGVAHFTKTKRMTTNPVPGDIVFFDWDNNGRWDHTGIFVKKIDDNFFETIEGNTSATNQSNGGQVQRRRRAFKNVCFAHPPQLD